MDNTIRVLPIVRVCPHIIFSFLFPGFRAGGEAVFSFLYPHFLRVCYSLIVESIFLEARLQQKHTEQLCCSESETAPECFSLTPIFHRKLARRASKYGQRSLSALETVLHNIFLQENKFSGCNNCCTVQRVEVSMYADWLQ